MSGSNAIPPRLREMMSASKTVQHELADAIGVTRTVVANWLNNRSRLSVENLSKIARYFGVSTDYLLGLTDVKRPEDAGLRAVCEYTGLSCEAVEVIVSCYKEQHSAELSEAIRSKPFMEMVFALRIVREKYFKEEAI